MSERKTSKKVSIELEPIGDGKKKTSLRSSDSGERPGTSNRPGTKDGRPDTGGSRPGSKKKNKNGDEEDEDDDVWSEYSDDWSDDGNQMASDTAQSAGDFFSRIGNAIHGAIFNFGPPYSNDTMDNSQLAFECQEYFASYTTVFKLLLKGANPNWKDEEDLFNTPTHFAAKHCHLHILRLFKEAHANFNIVNEMGQTPLIYAVLMKQKNVKRSKQLALVKYLLKQGADINFRDKGGYCAIDYAVLNDDLEIVNRLLNAGAKVMRSNEILVAKRRDLISMIGPTPTEDRNTIARMINHKYEKEQEEFGIRKQNREDLLKIQLEEARREKLQIYLKEKREMAELIARQNEQDRILAEKAEDLRRHILEEKEEFRKMLAGDRWRHGEYRKNEKTNLWEWHQEKIRKYEAIGEGRYKESMQQMDNYYDKNVVTNYQKQWRRITGGGNIEIKWQKADPFITLERQKALNKEIERERLQRLADETEDGAAPNSSSVDFRDENDDLLDGEDLSDLLFT